jgi:heptosyltransferase-2
MRINKDCRFFRGDMPCVYHKKRNVHCWNCEYYEQIKNRILIIKLGAAGDVVRTTPLLRKIKRLYDGAEVTWITNFPELVPSMVDNILNFELKNILYLLNTPFDIVINLDKDKEACALVNMIRAKSKKGFKLENGKVVPVNRRAEHKWLTGLFDDVNKKNKKSYIQEIFQIFGAEFNGEKYILDRTSKRGWNIGKKSALIGLNTGCGDRWKTRLWPEEYWIELIKLLKRSGYEVVLLGGEKEDTKNKAIAKKTYAYYFGYFPLKDFIGLIDQCDLVVTGVTMALHLAIGLGKKIVLLNNVFNQYEFELYNLGEIIEPEVSCRGCFKPICDKHCMEKIDTKRVFSACERLLREKRSKLSSI